jgi:hypothetical protein
MKGFIKLTNLKDKQPIYINVDYIVHLYEVKEKRAGGYGYVEEEAHTIIGDVAHNNGGFKVVETLEEIFEQLKKLN